jgi:outer membrane protein TolC
MGKLHRKGWRGRPCFTASTVVAALFACLAQPSSADPPAADKPLRVAPATEPRVLSLADCLQIALEQQPSLAAYRASLAAAETGRRALEKMALATLIARDLPIRKQQASLGVTIASAGLAQAEWETRYAVTRTYFSVIYAREQQRVTDEVVTNLKFYQERVSELVKKGASREWTTSTVDKITVYLRLAETRQAEAARGIDRAFAALREAMGVDPGFCFELADKGLPEKQANICRDVIVHEALARRGEMAQALTASEVTRLEIDAQGTSHMPTMRTFAAVADIHARPIPQGVQNTEYRPGAVGLDMPTTLAGHRSSRVERARDLSTRAAAVVDKTRLLITLEAEDAYFKWVESTRKVASTRDGAEAGARLAKHGREDFRAGQQVKIEDLLTNEVVVGQAQAAYNEARYQQALALAALERITAGGFDACLLAR